MIGMKVPTIFTAVDRFSQPVNKMTKSAEASMSRFDRKLRKISESSFQISRNTALMGTALVAPMGLFLDSAIKYEDKLADIAKTTGLEGDKLRQFGDGILEMSKKTRTSIDELAAIGEIGGQLGIAQDELLAFTDAADKFNIALGKDFGGVEEAVSQVGKIKALFGGTRDLTTAESINRIGSAINELGAIGAGTSANITDFTLRLGALPDVLKPSVENTIALGTFLEEVGINSERGASGLSKIYLTAGKEIGGFAKQMNISKEAAKNLLSENPTEFVKRFAKSFEGMPADVLSNKLSDLKLNSQEAIKVIGALGTGTERLTELQKESSKAFAAGTSLQDEAAKKNETMAARLEMAKNNMQALSITAGTTLVPILNELMTALEPVLNSFSAWVKENPKAISSIAKLAVKAAGLMFAISGLSAAVGVITKVMGVARYAVAAYNVVLGVTGALSGKASIAIGKSNVALKAYAVTARIASVASKLLSGPIGWITLGVGALAAGVYALSKAWSSETTEEKLNNEVRKRALENTIDQRVELSILFKTLEKAKQGSKQYNDTLKELEKMQPGIVQKYNLQEKSLKNINAAYKEMSANIIEAAKSEARADLIREKFKQSMQLKEEAQNLGLKGPLLDAVMLESLTLEKEANILAEEQADAQRGIGTGVISPATTSIKELKEIITVEFKNLPEGTSITSSKDGFVSPKTTTTN